MIDKRLCLDDLKMSMMRFEFMIWIINLIGEAVAYRYAFQEF
jgi:hypothetical protein